MKNILKEFHQFIEIAQNGMPEKTFEEVQKIKNISYKTSTKFFVIYGENGSISPLDAWRNFCLEINNSQYKQELINEKEFEFEMENDD